MAKGTRIRIAAENFIETWQKAGSPLDVAKALGTKIQSVKSRAAYYRKKGIGLKRFASSGRGAQPLDVSKLDKLAKSLAPKGEA